MKQIIQFICLIMVTLLISACSSTQKREVASDPCAPKYFIDEYSHFDHYETCNDY